MSQIVGIDPSLSCTAICWNRIETELFKSQSEGKSLESRIARFVSLAYRVAKKVRELEPIFIVIEGYSFASKGMVYHLGEYGGILRKELIDGSSAEFVEVPPSSLKKFVTGSGAGKKELMIARLSRKFGVEFSTSDAYDALACQWLGRALIGETDDLAEYQQEIVEKLRKANGISANGLVEA